MAFDADTLTLGEVAKVEELAGVSINAITEDATPKGKALGAIIFVLEKRRDPKYTLAQASQLTLGEAMKLLNGDDDDDGDDGDDGEGAEGKAPGAP